MLRAKEAGKKRLPLIPPKPRCRTGLRRGQRQLFQRVRVIYGFFPLSAGLDTRLRDYLINMVFHVV